MSNLTIIEKSKIETLFGMASGYVLNFSNKSFNNFIAECVGKNIDDETYSARGGSKANRLRQYFEIESNYTVAKLLHELLIYWNEHYNSPEPADVKTIRVYNDCLKIIERLKNDTPVLNIEAIQPNNNDEDFKIVAKSVKESIEKNEPEAGLDRLHTFTMKFIRELCRKNSIPFKPDDPLHSLFGSYVKFLRNSSKIDSEMTEVILKTSISVLEKFNHIRNNRSLAHDNPLLNYHESLLIYNNICNLIDFLNVIESEKTKTKIEIPDDYDLPF